MLQSHDDHDPGVSCSGKGTGSISIWGDKLWLLVLAMPLHLVASVTMGKTPCLSGLISSNKMRELNSIQTQMSTSKMEILVRLIGNINVYLVVVCYSFTVC